MHVQTHWAFYIGNGDSYSGPVLVDQAILLFVPLQSPISLLEIYGSWIKSSGMPKKENARVTETGDSTAAEHAGSEDIQIAPLTFHTTQHSNTAFNSAFTDFLIMSDHFPYYQRTMHSWCLLILCVTSKAP